MGLVSWRHRRNDVTENPALKHNRDFSDTVGWRNHKHVAAAHKPARGGASSSPCCIHVGYMSTVNVIKKKLSYRRGTARCVMLVNLCNISRGMKVRTVLISKIDRTKNRWNRALFGWRKKQFRLPLKLSPLYGSRPKSAMASPRHLANKFPNFIQIGSFSAEL